MVDLNRMAMFTKVVEAGSFSAAARALGLPKTSVSRQVQQLEEALGVRLLHRTTRKLELTAMGRAYFDEAVLGLRHLELANRRALAAQAVPSGVLRVAAVVEFGTRF
ncbi:LysR family transcriptional regulator [Rhizobium leguminosarum]|uniref:LysR family transcriptional regulator n=1 Tax=Rhizobium leguminosarum TaxID=384 RepID=UPI000FEC55F0|nr:LysR family transcriptional regulator [Rhizobium leguminosarum]RWX12877.1 LysR family transcriptional regulator [Rhizobium leguminosarum]